MARLEQEAHRLAEEALERQERTLTELRARTGTLFTVSVLVASFLGARVLPRDGLSFWIVLALFAFGVSISSCVYVLLPKDDLVFALDGPQAYEALYEFRYDADEIHRRLAYWLRVFGEANLEVLDRSNRAFEIASVALISEIAFWTLQIVLT
ncbi:MAG TPA: hypothetical protein VGK66_07090 [Solirubrobacterales bacterium]|nr:hypothetical protein [Solirubrobacterales bacterium]